MRTLPRSLLLLSLAVCLLALPACDSGEGASEAREVEERWSTILTAQGTTMEIDMLLDETEGEVEGNVTFSRSNVTVDFEVEGTYQAPDARLQFDPSGDPEGPVLEAIVSEDNQRLEGTLEGPGMEDVAVAFERE